jgi:DNA-binding beta-propeller fold protein YncE
MKNILRLVCLLFILAFASCRPKDIDGDNPPPSGAYRNGVWILNEGLFTSGNASVDFFHKDSSVREANIFQRMNKRPLGDVLQSMILYQDKYYAVVNNSQKIEVLDAKDFRSIGAIEGLVSPRYMMPVSPDKAYVTDLYARGISIINPANFSLTGKIEYNTGGDTAWQNWTEQMIKVDNEVFVCAVKEEALIVVNTDSDKITDTIPLLAEPQWMARDKNGNIWVMSDGSIDKRSSHLFRVNPANHSVEKQFTFPSTTIGPVRLKMNAAGDELYYIYKDVYRMNIADENLPAQPLIPANGKQLYGLGIDPRNGDIYLGDAVDHIQNGAVYRYKPDGTYLQTIDAGNSPMDFLFVD